MADKRIIDLEEKSDLVDQNLFYIIDSGEDKKTTLESIKKSVFEINYELNNDENVTNILGTAMNALVGSNSVVVDSYLVIKKDGKELYSPLFEIK